MTGFIVTKLDSAIYGWCKNYDCPFFIDYHGGKVVNGKDPDKIADSVECNIKEVLGCGKAGVYKSCPRGKIMKNYADTYVTLHEEAKLHALPVEQMELLQKIERIYRDYADEAEVAYLKACLEECNKV